VTKSKRIKQARNVASMENIQHIHNVLAGKYERKRPLGGQGEDGIKTGLDEIECQACRLN
jgi:hypothetical protein